MAASFGTFRTLLFALPRHTSSFLPPPSRSPQPPHHAHPSPPPPTTLVNHPLRPRHAPMPHQQRGYATSQTKRAGEVHATTTRRLTVTTTQVSNQVNRNLVPHCPRPRYGCHVAGSDVATKRTTTVFVVVRLLKTR
jgi:hypothetical protein